MSVRSRFENIVETDKKYNTLLELEWSAALKYSEGYASKYPAYSEFQKNQAIKTCERLGIQPENYEEILYLVATVRPNPYKSPLEKNNLPYENWKAEHENKNLAQKWAHDILSKRNRELVAISSKFRNLCQYAGDEEKIVVLSEI